MVFFRPFNSSVAMLGLGCGFGQHCPAAFLLKGQVEGHAQAEHVVAGIVPSDCLTEHVFKGEVEIGIELLLRQAVGCLPLVGQADQTFYLGTLLKSGLVQLFGRERQLRQSEIGDRADRSSFRGDRGDN